MLEPLVLKWISPLQVVDEVGRTSVIESVKGSHGVTVVGYCKATLTSNNSDEEGL